MGNFNYGQPVYNSDYPNIKNSEFFLSQKSGIIWYVCFLPLIGLFLENYCVSKWAGIFLWVAVVAMIITCCIIDYRSVKKLNSNAKSIRKWVWLAPVYVFKREKFCGREMYKAVMLGFFCVAALIMNGFTQGIRVTTSTIPGLVQNSYVQNLDNFSGSSTNIIGEQISAYFDEDTQWDCTKDGDNFYTTCTGKKDNDDYVITFDVVFDGFTYLSNGVVSIEKNGVLLNDDDLKSAFSTIFIGISSDNENGDNSNTVDSTQSDEISDYSTE